MVAIPTHSSISEYFDPATAYRERTLLLCVEKHQYNNNIDMGSVCIHHF